MSTMSTEIALISKMIGEKQWKIANKPPIYEEPHTEFFAARMLENPTVEYVEYVIAGEVYRLIKSEVLRAYI